ncbi:hypothetical protein CBL_01266 [Carabus blaptoides fortunei]
MAPSSIVSPHNPFNSIVASNVWVSTMHFNVLSWHYRITAHRYKGTLRVLIRPDLSGKYATAGTRHCVDFRLSPLHHAVQMICVMHSATGVWQCEFSYIMDGFQLFLPQAGYVSDETRREEGSAFIGFSAFYRLRPLPQ